MTRILSLFFFEDFGLASIADAMSYAAQIGNDVVFDFGSAELTILNMTLADIMDNLII